MVTTGCDTFIWGEVDEVERQRASFVLVVVVTVPVPVIQRGSRVAFGRFSSFVLYQRLVYASALDTIQHSTATSHSMGRYIHSRLLVDSFEVRKVDFLSYIRRSYPPFAVV